MNDLRMWLGESGRRLRGALRPPLTARVGPAGIFLEQGGGKWQGEAAAGASPGEEIAAVVTAFRQLLFAQRISPGRVNLIASDHWLRPLLFALPPGHLSDPEIDALVAYRYRQIYGGQMQGWVWRWARQAQGPLVAMAWPTALLGGLRAAIAEWGGTLASARPESLHALQLARAGRDDAWIVVAQQRHATVVRVTRDTWQYWRCRSLDPAPAAGEAASVCDLVQRSSARLGDDCREIAIVESGACGAWPREVVRRLTAEGWTTHDAPGTATGHPPPPLDFAHTREGAATARNALFAAVALLLGIELGTLAWALQSMAAEQAQLEDERGRLIKRLRPGDPPLSKELGVRVRAVREMVARLSIPWEALLTSLETLKGDKIVVESLRPDPADRKVEISGTAPAFGDIREFLDRLNASQELHRAVLVSETEGREPGIRFVATATWRAAE
jgi:hypothetical protein